MPAEFAFVGKDGKVAVANTPPGDPIDVPPVTLAVVAMFPVDE
jgi:hypothetical protein